MEFEKQLESEIRKNQLLEEIASLNIEIYKRTSKIELHRETIQDLDEQINKLKTELRDE